MSTRKSSEVVQFGLRIRENLRVRLEREAKKNQVPISKEIISRLERSLDGEAMKTIEESATDITKILGRARKQLESA